MYQTLSHELDRAVNLSASGASRFPNKVKSRINEITLSRPFDLPSMLDHLGYELSAKDCLNLLLLYIEYDYGVSDRNPNLSDVLKGCDNTNESMWLWLVYLGIADPNGFIDEHTWFNFKLTKFRKNYKNGLPKDITLTGSGVTFLNRARYIFENYGFKLVMKDYPHLNFANYAGN